MKDDKRRTPYNIWVCVLGFVIMFVVGGIGYGIFKIGINAESKVILSQTDEYCWDCVFERYHTVYTYDEDVNLRPNDALYVSRTITQLIGIIISAFGVVLGIIYNRTRWWYEGEKSHRCR